MEKIVFYVILLLIANSQSLHPENLKYRNDYEYDGKTNAFFKFHIEARINADALAKCKAEGAQLMVPRSPQDVIMAHAMLKRYPDLGNYVLIGNDGLKHDSVEETPLINLETANINDTPTQKFCEVINRKGDIESSQCFQARPFICKVEADDVVYDRHCGVYAGGYTFVESTGSCYKVPQVAYTWNEAEAECRGQGAHLLIINSDAEHQAIAQFLSTAPRLRTASVDYFYFVGFRAEKPSRNFKTVFNQTLAEAGFAVWQAGEPNNYQDSEYCGAVFRSNAEYNDVNCSKAFAFVCEREVQLKT